ncbi:hypothetical protein H072_2711 [Dactylellina haptotyla CBS 200.50]|uniref:Uncharacterized protein n=1 Tax=Dactylellina haptotyla (strain CBS 200.50) TaxID=1284197 RepID=S8AQG1_DACHA|nr:hypothetical protein H072_2711 [Dactylellina haptotyla CBS 200.50]
MKRCLREAAARRLSTRDTSPTGQDRTGPGRHHPRARAGICFYEGPRGQRHVSGPPTWASRVRLLTIILVILVILIAIAVFILAIINLFIATSSTEHSNRSSTTTAETTAITPYRLSPRIPGKERGAKMLADAAAAAAAPPSDKPPRSYGNSNRRRSTSSVFSNLRHASLLSTSSSSSPHPAANDTVQPKPKLPGRINDSSLSREVQQDALELNSSSTDDAESQEREELAEILAQGGWAPSEIALFKRLRRRGREPLLPAPWRLDFATFPEALYAPVSERSFICALTPSMEFRGSQALQRLVNIGGQVRDRTEINPSAPVEPLIYQEIKNFLTWAEKDAETSTSSILTVNYNRNKKATSKTTSERTERKMKSMANELRGKNQRPQSSNLFQDSIGDPETPKAPTVVYGVTVYNCVAAISSLSSENAETNVKTLVVLDWTDIGLDIWNAIAIAILVVSCRNDILDSDEEARLKLVEQNDEDA